MPCSITFRPQYEEFIRYKEDFKDSFMKKFNKNNFVLTPEKGNSDTINHYQIFLDTDKRVDSIKRTLATIMKGYEISYPKVALRVKDIKTNVNGVIGYCLKEHDNFDDITHNGFDIPFLLQCKNDYDNLSICKKINIDKMRVNARNFYSVFMNYCSTLETIEPNSFDIISKIIDKMVLDGYCCFDLLLDMKRKSKIIDELLRLYTLSLSNDNLIV